MELMDVLYPKKNKQKVVWIKCGILYKNDDGMYRLRMDAIPISTNFDGWYVVKPRPKREAEAIDEAEDIGDDIPF